MEINLHSIRFSFLLFIFSWGYLIEKLQVKTDETLTNFLKKWHLNWKILEKQQRIHVDRKHEKTFQKIMTKFKKCQRLAPLRWSLNAEKKKKEFKAHSHQSVHSRCPPFKSFSYKNRGGTSRKTLNIIIYSLFFLRCFAVEEVIIYKFYPYGCKKVLEILWIPAASEKTRQMKTAGISVSIGFWEREKEMTRVGRDDYLCLIGNNFFNGVIVLI